MSAARWQKWRYRAGLRRPTSSIWIGSNKEEQYGRQAHQDRFRGVVAKATQRLEDKRIPRKRRLYVPSIDEEITIRSLTTREIADVTDSDNEDVPAAG